VPSASTVASSAPGLDGSDVQPASCDRPRRRIHVVEADPRVAPGGERAREDGPPANFRRHLIWPGQDRIAAIAPATGGRDYLTTTTGKNVLFSRQAARTYTGTVPRVDPAAMSRGIGADPAPRPDWPRRSIRAATPWAARTTSWSWDGRPFETWQNDNAQTPNGPQAVFFLFFFFVLCFFFFFFFFFFSSRNSRRSSESRSARSRCSSVLFYIRSAGTNRAHRNRRRRPGCDSGSRAARQADPEKLTPRRGKRAVTLS